MNYRGLYRTMFTFIRTDSRRTRVQFGEEGIPAGGIEEVAQDFDGFELKEEKRFHESKEQRVVGDVGRVARLPVERQFRQRSMTLRCVPRRIDFPLCSMTIALLFFKAVFFIKIIFVFYVISFGHSIIKFACL